jgi:hypothetical protein
MALGCANMELIFAVIIVLAAAFFSLLLVGQSCKGIRSFLWDKRDKRDKK